MSSCGLMFAGASNTLVNKEAVDSPDDGILTGCEISFLDLTGIETVDLSAYETGLEDIDLEGVIGLQRAIKHEGVWTLVVSLWKVSDEATFFLMTEFYRYRLSRCNASLALRQAQDFLRKTRNGLFDNYEDWDTFIVLDTL